MDKAAMVSIDVSLGSELLDILDRARLKVSVALWVFLSEYEDWRLVVAGRQLDSPDPRDAYRLVHDSLNAAGFRQKPPPVLILRMNDPFIRELRRILGKTRSVDGTRMGGQMIGDRFVLDAYVYRVS
jgi:hypothetical protein